MKTTTLQWILRGLLAVIFLFAGGAKLWLPAAALAQQAPLPVAFLRFIGVAEVAGALGLVLPELLRIKQGLVPLAAAGLVLLMIGATVVTLRGPRPASAGVPAAVGLIAAFVAWRAARQIRSARRSRPAATPSLGG